MSVQVGLLLSVVTPGSMVSILLLSVSRETRHEVSSVVLPMVEMESESLATVVSLGAELVSVESSAVKALQGLLAVLRLSLLLLLLLLSVDPTMGMFPPVSGVTVEGMLWFFRGVRHCAHMWS